MKQRQSAATNSAREQRVLDHCTEWDDKQNAKRTISKDNTEARAKRSNQQQLALLDQRLGEGAGAKKERARLAT